MTQIKLGSKATGNVICSNCGKASPVGEQFTYKGKNGNEIYLCNECKVKVNQAFETQTKNINKVRSFIGGFIGAFLGGLAWYIIELMTGYEIGYVAVGVGYLVVKGISIGSGYKKGNTLQIMSVCLTLLAIFGAKYFLGVHYIQDALLRKYPDADQIKVYIFSLTTAGKDFFSYAITPVGLFIWGIALYIAYRGLKPAKI